MIVNRRQFCGALTAAHAQFLFFHKALAQMIEPKSTSEKIMYSTVRIVGLNPAGQPIQTGTGFYFAFPHNGRQARIIVTNKHVIAGTTSVECVVHAAAPGASKPSTNLPLRVASNAWTGHPDPKIDLCGLPFGDSTGPNEVIPFVATIDPTLIPAQDKLEELGAVEDVLMVGYPNGLWDTKNNFPLMRRGITASHPALDFDVDGVPTVVIDAACFPGSSGSPVFIYNEGGIPQKGGSLAIGSRIMFLGVLYSGPVMQADGKIVPKNIPTAIVNVAEISLMLNLGYIIKAREVMTLASYITSQVK